VSRRVWIAGASYGIGAALARRLAEAGDEVIASARSKDKLEALATESGGRITAAPLDVTDRDAVLGLVERIEEDRGAIDLAILNAGSHHPVKARDFKAEELRALTELNLMGTAHGLEALMPRMIGRGAGHIAVVASVAGYRGLPTAAYYGATKAAVINMTEALRFDLTEAGVKLQLIDPGFVETPLTAKNDFPMPFIIKAEDAARRIEKGLLSSRFEIVFPRRMMVAMKLLRLLPYRLFFPLMARSTGK